MPSDREFEALAAEVRRCRICEDVLPLGPHPVFQLHPAARILVASQAPGRKVHDTGVPFNDASGERLRRWLGLGREAFYNPRLVAIVPIGLCYPGRGRSGDLPPRPECAPRWRASMLATLVRRELTLAIGQYALDWHLGTERGNLTQIVRRWQEFWPAVVPLPHPSPRNNGWLAQNPWFERELVPQLQQRVAQILRRSRA